MKIIIKFILILFLGMFICSCEDSDIPDNGGKDPEEEPGKEPPKPIVPTDIWIVSAMSEISTYKRVEPSNEIILHMAKGEYEHFQLVIDAKDAKSIDIERTVDDASLISYIRDIKAFNGKDDVLIPIDKSVEVVGEIAKLWVTYKTPIDIKAGVYKDVITFSNDVFNTTIEVRVKVYDCTIPETPSYPALFGVNPSRIEAGLTGEALMQKRKLFFDALLDRRAMPYSSAWMPGSMKMESLSSPYNWDDERTMDYFADPRFTHLLLPSHKLTDPELASFTESVKSRFPEKPQVFYLWDEPTLISEYDQLRVMADRVHKINPQAEVLTTFFRGPKDDGARESITNSLKVWDHLDGVLDIFCTGAWVLRGNESYSNQVKAKCKEDQQWWMYTCMADSPGLAYNSTPIANRATSWRIYKEETKGYLYWSTNAFSKTVPLKERPELPDGDGILTYPGKSFNSEEVLLSMRLERWCDGAEDYELLLLLEKKIGRDATLNILKTVYQSPKSFTTKTDLVYNFKKKLLTDLTN